MRVVEVSKQEVSEF